MAGIYIHIPFCKRACHYCNFHFSTTLHQKNDFVDALLAEISLIPHKDRWPVSTIYLGGGTPSLLDNKDLERILAAVHDAFRINPNPECTLEANPDDISPEKLRHWLGLGINRLSVGIQSFREEDLQWMNRAHNADQAKQCLDAIPAAGFTNFSADLIYGTPGLSNASWKENIRIMTGAGVPHISAYALTVEKKTALDLMIRQGKKDDTNPEIQSQQFNILIDALGIQGYQHYEISNFALPGMHSRHNAAYWEGLPYLGLGPSAHSYDGRSRSWNIANTALYIRSLQKGIIPNESEDLNAEQQLNEYIMTALRTSTGINLDRITAVWGDEKVLGLLKTAAKYMKRGQLIQDNNHLVLTRNGKFFADGIAADLFL